MAIDESMGVGTESPEKFANAKVSSIKDGKTDMNAFGLDGKHREGAKLLAVGDCCTAW